MSDFGINLRGADICVSEHLGKGFDGNAVGQADFRRHGMAAGMQQNRQSKEKQIGEDKT